MFPRRCLAKFEYSERRETLSSLLRSSLPRGFVHSISVITELFHSSFPPPPFNFYIASPRARFHFFSRVAPLRVSRFCFSPSWQRKQTKGKKKKHCSLHSGATISGIGNEFNELASSRGIPSAFLLFHRPAILSRRTHATLTAWFVKKNTGQVLLRRSSCPWN